MVPGERRSIAVYVYREREPRYLMLKRVSAKGGFWQPVTGRVEDADGLTGARARIAAIVAGARRVVGVRFAADREHLMAAALREVEEETGITDVLTVVDLGMETRFTGYDGARYAERAFAAEVPSDVNLLLSWEHDEAKWCTREEAEKLLRFDENKEALSLLESFLEQ